MKKIILAALLALFSATCFSQGITTPFKIAFFGNGTRTDSLPYNVNTVMGLDIGILGTTTPHVFGLQIGALSAVSDDLWGIQAAGLGAKGDVKGLQISPCVSGDVTGVSAGLLNLNYTVGLDLALAKGSSGATAGVLVSGLSFSESVTGLHIGLVNLNYGEMTGLQIGIVNYAKTLKGVQIGVVNIAYNGVLPFMAGANFRF
ncbi:hypothetical protein Emin_1433 [Elusimicrobium minutum Pei191]|uniref:Outer membrane protein beta-barrel domain-containing protein n=1 Tax=Elusimicrobium minutum (strain Pei191) TaxID=445932 RepID=B2KEN6_ELUMP|nr:hypothetical protein [Elusimicrobium minutum]ACC98982.1 hypothetical protein Emin_1433 [Elusimicrobium minutum Pei191]